MGATSVATEKNPAQWSDVSEVVTDLANDLVRRNDWDPQQFKSPHQALLSTDEAVDNDRGEIRPDEPFAEAEFFAVDDPEAPVALDELRLGLAMLPPEQREALILVGAGGFAYEEAADICNCAVGTVKSRVSRARRALHAILEAGDYARDGGSAGDAMRSILADAERLASIR